MTVHRAEPAPETSVRAFFAVLLSARARDAADAVASELRSRPYGDGVRWVRPENFHVTLRFLGEIPRSSVLAVAECAVDAIAAAPDAHEPFEMRLGEVGAFPSLRRPRVVVLGVTPPEPLQALADSLERGIENAGLRDSADHPAHSGSTPSTHAAEPSHRDPERKHPLRAHLTLGRVRRGRRAPSLESPCRADPAPTRVEEIALLRSELGREGARYTRLERIPLVCRD